MGSGGGGVQWWGWLQVEEEGRFRWGGGFSEEGEEQRKNVRGLKGSKETNARGELNGIFLQFEFRFRNGLGRTLALQNFRITHLIKAEFLAKILHEARNKNKVD